jgi:ribosomal protein S18 acetylase RimI-like enzyme
VETWQHAYAGLVVQQRLDAMQLDEYRARWRGNITDPTEERVFLVVEVRGLIAAYAIGGPYRPQGETGETDDAAVLGEVYALYAHPAMQGRGFGRAVHDELLVRLARQGYAEAALWVLRDNERGRAWYERQGWRSDGSTSDWVAHDVAHPEVRMRRRTSD